MIKIKNKDKSKDPTNIKTLKKYILENMQLAEDKGEVNNTTQMKVSMKDILKMISVVVIIFFFYYSFKSYIYIYYFFKILYRKRKIDR
jgi:hypothetical protein